MSHQSKDFQSQSQSASSVASASASYSRSESVSGVPGMARPGWAQQHEIVDSNTLKRQEADNEKYHKKTMTQVDELVKSLCQFKEKSIKLDGLMQNMIVFDSIFEEQLNPGEGEALQTISKANTYDSIKKVIQEQYFQYTSLMRLMDTVFPSASMLEECIEREVVECGGVEVMDKAPIPEEIRNEGPGGEEIYQPDELNENLGAPSLKRVQAGNYQASVLNKYFKQSQKSLRNAVLSHELNADSYRGSEGVMRSVRGSSAGGSSMRSSSIQGSMLGSLVSVSDIPGFGGISNQQRSFSMNLAEQQPSQVQERGGSFYERQFENKMDSYAEPSLVEVNKRSTSLAMKHQVEHFGSSEVQNQSKINQSIIGGSQISRSQLRSGSRSGSDMMSNISKLDREFEEQEQTTNRRTVTAPLEAIAEADNEGEAQEEYDSELDEAEEADYDGSGKVSLTAAEAAARAAKRRRQKEEKEKALLSYRVFPHFNQLDKVCFGTEVNNRYDEYGKLCEMFLRYPGYGLRILRRIVRERYGNETFYDESHGNNMTEWGSKINQKIREQRTIIDQEKADARILAQASREAAEDAKRLAGDATRIKKSSLVKEQNKREEEAKRLKDEKELIDKKNKIKDAIKSLKSAQREKLHHKWLSKGSIFKDNLDSLVVNISRYLYESPHSEESNYFSTTHYNDEKPFLLMLAMFITNVDLSIPNDKECQAYKEPALDKPTANYRVPEPEMIDTFTLLFEGQTRKFSSFKLLVGMIHSTKDGLNQTNKKQVVDIVEDYCIENVDVKVLNEKLIYNNNQLQFAGDFEYTKSEQRRFKSDLKEIKKEAEKIAKINRKLDLTQSCLDFADSMLERLEKNQDKLPVTIRIMLKFRVGIERHGMQNGAKILQELPSFDTTKREFDEYDLDEAEAIAQLLLGVWLNPFFVFPQIISSSSNNVNVAFVWCAKLVFEHLMTLRTLDAKKFVDVDTAQDKYTGLLDFSKINSWLKMNHKRVALFYNSSIRVETGYLVQSVSKNQELLGGLHVKIKGAITEAQEKLTEMKNHKAKVKKQQTEARNYNRDKKNEPGFVKKDVPELPNYDNANAEVNEEREKKVQAIINGIVKQQEAVKTQTLADVNAKNLTAAEKIDLEVKNIFLMDSTQQMQLKLLRQLSILGITDFYTLTYICSVEFDDMNERIENNVEETFAVALEERGDLRVAVNYFKEHKDLILNFLEKNRFRTEKEQRILAEEKAKEIKTEAALLYKKEKDKFKKLLRDYQHALQDDLGKFEEELKDGTYQGMSKEQMKKPVFKMKKKADTNETAERPNMSNNCFILGLNKIPNHSFLTQDIDAKLKKARQKVTEKWIEQYIEGLPPHLKMNAEKDYRKKHLKKVITRVYYFFKLHLRSFNLEKLLTRGKFKSATSKTSDNITDLGYLMNELKQIYYAMDNTPKNQEMITIVDQLEYDLKELDMLSRTTVDSKSHALEMEQYVFAQGQMITEFTKFLEDEIKFADEIQLKLQAQAKSIQSQMHDMQNSILNVRAFINKKAPFMIKEFTSERQGKYLIVKELIGQECLKVLYNKISEEQDEIIAEIYEYYAEDILAYVYQLLCGPTPREFTNNVKYSYCKFDYDAGLIPMLRFDQEYASQDQFYQSKLSMPSAVSARSEMLQIVSKEDLLQSLLTANNPVWGDARLYETQISKLRENFTLDSKKLWNGRDVEKLIGHAVQSSLTLMEMTEIETETSDKNESTLNAGQKIFSIEEKVFLVTAYMIGVLILDAHELETQEKKDRREDNKKYWLSEMKIVRQLIITVCFNFSQYDCFYTQAALDALNIKPDGHQLPVTICQEYIPPWMQTTKKVKKDGAKSQPGYKNRNKFSIDMLK